MGMGRKNKGNALFVARRKFSTESGCEEDVGGVSEGWIMGER